MIAPSSVLERLPEGSFIIIEDVTRFILNVTYTLMTNNLAATPVTSVNFA